MEGHEPAAQVFVAFATLCVTAALVFITFRYAKSAARHAETSVVMAQETKRLAEATRDMVHATLCPVIEQWLAPDQKATNFSVVYTNSGNGHAVGIEWYLQYEDGTQKHSQKRIGMRSGDMRDSVQFSLDPSSSGSLPTVVAEYESVFGALWRSTLSLIEQNGRLANGDPEVKRINQRRE